MKNSKKYRLKLWYTLPIFLLFVFSCNNDLDLLAPPKQIPIVYGLLDINDSLQIIRIEKAFSPNQDAKDIAQNKDSIYFDNIQVYLNDILLNKSDGHPNFPMRNEGVFLSDPNVFYFISSKDLDLIPAETYTLKIIQNDLEIGSAQAILVPEFSIFAPQMGNTIDFNRQNVVFRWASEELIKTYDVRIDIFVLETENDETNIQRLTWELASNYDNTRFAFSGSDFYDFIAGSLEIRTGMVRRIESIFINISGAGEAYDDFKRINQSNQGLTGFTTIPSYSNIDQGLGLFSSRYVHPGVEVFLNNSSMDSLKMGSRTKDLGF